MPMDKIHIKLAKEADAKVIALLGRITFNETFGHLFRYKSDILDYHDKTFAVEKISKGIVKPENIFWIATVNQLPVGYAKLKLNSESEFINSENICQLQKIYVLNDFLSMKIGLELQNRLLAKAEELGFEKIWLSVLNENLRAINFYKKNGFRAMGNHGFQIGKEHFDFTAMAKKL